MKKIYISGLFLVIVLLFITACETDFKTTADYQDITVVYGLLDSKDSMQYLKINKAFLSESNVLEYAMMEDSNSYPYPLDVWVEEWTPAGDSVKAFYFDTTTIYNKEPGQFYYPDQVVYRWQKPDKPYKIQYIVEGLNDTIGIEYFWMNDKDHYKLKIRNPKTNKVITAETNLVEDFVITKPSFATFIRFVPEPTGPKEFSWSKAVNGGKYEFELRFNYRELRFGESDTTDKYIVLASSSAIVEPGSSSISYYYWDDQFFSTCLAKIPFSDPNEESQVKVRFTGKVDVIVSVAEEQYAFYLQVNEPSTGIIQEKPQYTNIDNGLGIFSSRVKKIKSKRLHTETVSDLKSMDNNVMKFQY
jgi:hypothetical protein